MESEEKFQKYNDHVLLSLVTLFLNHFCCLIPLTTVTRMSMRRHGDYDVHLFIDKYAIFIVLYLWFYYSKLMGYSMKRRSGKEAASL